MLGFFKVNDPYRLVGILLILVLIRLLFFWLGVPIMVPEIKWLLVGEKLTEGGTMYRDVWDNTPPLAASIYYWLFVCFGKSIIPYRILSILLVFFQAAIFNNMLLKNKAYNQNTYVPALVYMLFMNISFDFFTLSPVLMGMTFILLATNNLFKRMDNQTKDDLFVQMGVYLGIATLFFLPSIVYFLITIVSLLIYTGSIFRRMLLMVYGYLIVIILAGVYYYWNDGFNAFRFQFIESIFRLNATEYISLQALAIFTAIPLSIFIFSFFKTTQHGRFINFQIKIQRVMLFFLLLGIPAMLMVKDFSTFQLIYFVPTIAFFVTHYILTIKNWFISEVTFLLFFLVIIVNNLFPLRNYLHMDKFASYGKLISEKSEFIELTRNKKILILGEDIDRYSEAKLATPYLNWQYSKYHLENPNFYENLTKTYVNFTNDMPQVIIDQVNAVPKLFEKMPTIQARYEKLKPSVYILKP